MREILFRGKRIDNGEWIEGSLLITKFNTYIIPMYDESIVYQKPISVDSETIGQFIGLTDKNGVKIFEGDIVKMVYSPIGANPKVIEYYKIGVIIWPFYVIWKIEGTNVLDEGLALSHQKTKKEQYSHPTSGLDWIDKQECSRLYRDEVIGNIHDNLELLKEL